MNKSNCGAKVKIWDWNHLKPHRTCMHPKTPGHLLQMLSTDPFQSLKALMLMEGEGMVMDTLMYRPVYTFMWSTKKSTQSSSSIHRRVDTFGSCSWWRPDAGPLMLMTDCWSWCCCYWVSIAAALLAGGWLLVVGFLVITFLGSSGFQEATHKPSWATSVSSSHEASWDPNIFFLAILSFVGARCSHEQRHHVATASSEQTLKALKFKGPGCRTLPLTSSTCPKLPSPRAPTLVSNDNMTGPQWTFPCQTAFPELPATVKSWRVEDWDATRIVETCQEIFKYVHFAYEYTHDYIVYAKTNMCIYIYICSRFTYEHAYMLSRW